MGANSEDKYIYDMINYSLNSSRELALIYIISFIIKFYLILLNSKILFNICLNSKIRFNRTGTTESACTSRVLALLPILWHSLLASWAHYTYKYPLIAQHTCNHIFVATNL